MTEQTQSLESGIFSMAFPTNINAHLPKFLSYFTIRLCYFNQFSLHRWWLCRLVIKIHADLVI